MEIGQELQHRREHLGLSLEKIEHLTKIQKRYLRAIETSDWGSLPEPVYTRGFIHSYARTIGLELSDLQLELDVEADDFEPVSESNYRGIVRERSEQDRTLVHIIKYLVKIVKLKS